MMVQAARTALGKCWCLPSPRPSPKAGEGAESSRFISDELNSLVQYSQGKTRKVNMHVIEALEAQKRLTSLLDKVAKGGRVLITRDGKPVAKLIPAEPGFDRVKAPQAADGLRALAKGLTLGGLSIRDLTNEGRR